MAVVQISKIQIRRGQKNLGTGLPQLASGELAWAIDAQELWIGNGAVSEGSPAVGNTKILTQNDLSAQGNLLGLLEYVYKPTDTTIVTGPDANNPSTRSVQARLDDRVNLVDFYNVDIDDANDFTVVIQRAIDQLFLNINHPSHSDQAVETRVVLELPPGEYNITSTIYVPSYTTIVGAGIDKTILKYDPTIEITSTRLNNGTTINTSLASEFMVGASISGGNLISGTTITSVVAGVSIGLSNGPVSGESTPTVYTIIPNKPAMQFVNDLSVPGTPSPLSNTGSTQAPKFIQIRGLTVSTVTGTNPGMLVDAVQNSVFENIKLIGNWTSGSDNEIYSRGIEMRAKSSLIATENNLFNNIVLTGFYYAVYAKYDSLNNLFQDVEVSESRQGFVLGGDIDNTENPESPGDPDIANGSTAGQQYGPREFHIVNAKFDHIYRHAVIVQVGTSNSVRDSKFYRVGNDAGYVLDPTYPVVHFETFGNTFDNNYTDRHENLATSNLSKKYVPELSGHGLYNSFGTRTITGMSYQVGYVSLFRLPVPTTQYGFASGIINYSINYYYTSSQGFSRRGVLTVNVDTIHSKIQLSDEFDFAGNNGTTDSLLLDFRASFLDELGGTWVSPETPGSIQISYTNGKSSDSGYLVYSYTAQS